MYADRIDRIRIRLTDSLTVTALTRPTDTDSWSQKIHGFYPCAPLHRRAVAPAGPLSASFHWLDSIMVRWFVVFFFFFFFFVILLYVPIFMCRWFRISFGSLH